MKILAPLPVLLLLLLPCLAEGRLVNAFTDKNTGCPKFFFPNPADQNTHLIPTILHDDDNPERYAKICQVFNKEVRFATLYDTTHRIPVYSAYTYDPTQAVVTGRFGKWKIETQLEKFAEDDNMNRANNIKPPPDGQCQALDGDYTGSEYTRGHLYPNCYARDVQAKMSTCTLTNAAPQFESHNGQWATKVEQPVLTEIIDKCGEPAYIVTGVVPGNTWLKNDERVNVPSYFWTAYCCKDVNGVYVSTAFLSEHNKVEKNAKFMEKMTVKQLEDTLYVKYSAVFYEYKDKKKVASVCEHVNKLLEHEHPRADKDPTPHTLFGGKCG